MTAKVTGLVILEGPDGAGKTTLGQFLAERYGGLYVHRTYSPTMNIWDHHAEALFIAQKESHEKLVIVDRLWPSEHIYGRVFREGGYYGDYNSRSMERVIKRLCGVYVLCVPDDVDYIVRVHAEKKGKGLEMFDTVKEVAVRYLDWRDGSIVRPVTGDLIEQESALGGAVNIRKDIVFYDVTTMGNQMKAVGNAIIDKIEERQRDQYAPCLDPNHQNVLGYLPEATHLFVGEELGSTTNPSKWAFFGHTHCADFLNRSLHAIAWREELGMWTNAINSDPQIKAILEAKPSLKVVCLGGIARDKCHMLGIRPHAVVPHPQHQRRFNYHGKNGRPYSEVLGEATS